jgi:hypothetical protein
VIVQRLPTTDMKMRALFKSCHLWIWCHNNIRATWTSTSLSNRSLQSKSQRPTIRRAPDREDHSIFLHDTGHTHKLPQTPTLRQRPPSLLLKLPTIIGRKKNSSAVKFTITTSELPISMPNSGHQDLTPAPCKAVGLSCSSHVEVLPLLLPQEWRE